MIVASDQFKRLTKRIIKLDWRFARPSDGDHNTGGDADGS